jgi:hypothetical protein
MKNKRSYYVLCEHAGQFMQGGSFSDVAYEEIAAVVASSPKEAVREARREHAAYGGAFAQGWPKEVVVIPASAIKVVPVQ